ncbi:MAG TPA: hypothetical protein VJS66_08810 [Burkholderiales bacterium]|nr:hypothetical protein [Burkholderiales bacterium]
MIRLRLLACAVLWCSVVNPIHAEELDLRFGIENFRWREYNASGGRLLEEKGPRVHVGVDWRAPIGNDDKLLLDVSGTFYFGHVDYDGQACTLAGTCRPYQSDADYLGAQGRVLFVRRFGDVSGFELFGGGGLDMWQRDIDGDTTVSGAIENWYVFYAAAGVGSYWRGPAVRGNARIGVKYPFYTEEYPDSYDVTLNPEGRPSLFAQLKFDFMNGSRPSWGLGIYYDSYRFDESDQERDGSVIVWQPESRQETIGVFATIPLRY